MLHEWYTDKKWEYACYPSGGYQVILARSPRLRQYRFIYDKLDLVDIEIINANSLVFLSSRRDFRKCVSKIPTHVLLWVNKMVEGLQYA